ncbi:MAG: hypothetical protein ACFFC5_07565 [Promethearchaeota archaeon]
MVSIMLGSYASSLVPFIAFELGFISTDLHANIAIPCVFTVLLNSFIVGHLSSCLPERLESISDEYTIEILNPSDPSNLESGPRMVTRLINQVKA